MLGYKLLEYGMDEEESVNGHELLVINPPLPSRMKIRCKDINELLVLEKSSTVYGKIGMLSFHSEENG